MQSACSHTWAAARCRLLLPKPDAETVLAAVLSVHAVPAAVDGLSKGWSAKSAWLAWTNSLPYWNTMHKSAQRPVLPQLVYKAKGGNEVACIQNCLVKGQAH
jgi:hypothetical protein